MGDDESVFVECRRLPPQLIGRDDPAVAWPQVEEADWCGEYRREGPPGELLVERPDPTRRCEPSSPPLALLLAAPFAVGVLILVTLATGGG